MSEPVSPETSDGFHTFAELYEHRTALTAALYSWMPRDCRWKSRRHDDHTMFDGFFIVGMMLTTGLITYHVPLALWDAFGGPELPEAPPWDGHLPGDVVARLVAYAASAAR